MIKLPELGSNQQPFGSQPNALPLSYRGKNVRWTFFRHAYEHYVRVCRGASVILNTPSILNLKNLNIEQHFIQPVRQVIGLLVTVSCTPHGASTSVLSTPYSPGGLSRSLSWTSHLKVGFTLRCLQRLSLPDLAILPWDWFPTGPPVIRPSRSSRTKDSSLQMSYACAG